MKKILVILVFLFSAQSAFADCNIKDIGLGQKFSDIKEKYKFNGIFVNENIFYKNIRGEDLCTEFKGAEVSMLFLKYQLAKVDVYRRSSNDGILQFLIKALGEPERLPNKDDPELRSYSTYWDKGNNITTYSFSYSAEAKIFTEHLMIQNKELADEMREFTNMDEEKKSTLGIGEKE